MGFFIFNKLQKLWTTWDLRGFVLFSLFLQSFLILASPFRKRTANAKVTGVIWLFYLVADWAATFAVGLISRSQGYDEVSEKINDLMAFWAAFLLNHLGGPDTITAFALEDNELWLRHTLQLGTQLAATLYVFYKSIPSDIWLPSLLMIFAGFIKYSERTMSLYFASVNKFRNSLLTEPDPGPNYAKLMEEYTMRKDARLPADIENIKEPELEFEFSSSLEKDRKLNDLEMIQDAYKWFNKFKGLVADLIFSIHDWKESREYFHNRDAEQAFRVMEIELNFIYEVLYTKMVIIHKKVGYLFRVLCFGLVFSSFWLWYSKDKSQLDKYDVRITYILLYGALALDAIAFVMLIFSYWMIAHIKINYEVESQNETNGGHESLTNKFTRNCKSLIEKFLKMSKPKWSDFTEQDKTAVSIWLSRIFCFCCLEETKREPIPFKVFAARIFYRRWSESIQQFNLIDYSLNVRNEKIEMVINGVGLKDLLDGIQYVSQRWFPADLKETIFSELLKKSKKVEKPGDAALICKARGEWVLEEDFPNIYHSKILEPWLTKIDYDESLILWHIATEVCYNHDFDEETIKPIDETEEVKKHREVSKIMSDYMLYLLLRQPKMMTSVAGIGQFRFRDTCAEGNKFFGSLVLDPKDKNKRFHKACKKLLEVNTDIPPRDAKGDRSKSVLFEGCRLAKELIKLEKEGLEKGAGKGEKVNKWKVMHKVWAEMLCYAATNCSGNAHAAQLSKGGQLLTFVWLLMVHFGLGKHFLINEGNARAKLKIGR